MKLFVIILAMVFAPWTRAVEGDQASADATWADIATQMNAIENSIVKDRLTKPDQQDPLFHRKISSTARMVADRMRLFHLTYPHHPKADEARKLEMAWITKSIQSGQEERASPRAQKIDPGETPEAKHLRETLQKVHTRIQKAEKAGPLVALAEKERMGRSLVTEFPAELTGWNFLSQAAQGMGKEKAILLFEEVAAKAPDAKLKVFAEGRLKWLRLPMRVVPEATYGAGMVGRPLQLEFTAVDGRKVDITELRGKVVLVDFWATWCPACMVALPKIKEAYKELHGEGFEILGVSFDESREDLEAWVRGENLSWPQFWDGGGWQNAINLRFKVNQIPTMYLVDKQGIVRDIPAVDGLVEKARYLLQEK